MTPSTQSTIEELAQRRFELIRRVPEMLGGLEWCKLHGAIVDEAVAVVCSDALGQFHGGLELSIVATGGYGRRELAPGSDIDLTVIPLDEADRESDDAVRALFQGLHSAFGSSFRMELGYAYRLINDAAALDAKSRTAMLDSRLVAGSPKPFDDFLNGFRESFPAGEFLLDKIAERRRSFGEFNDTPLVVEPQLKEGAGGLRCFQCANWIRATMGEVPAPPTGAYDAVLRARNLLHFVAEKRLDVLSRQRQGEIAELLGTEPGTFMEGLAESLVDLNDAYVRAVESLQESRFSVSPGVLAVRGEARVSARASLSDAALGISLATRLGLDVEAMAAPATLVVDGPEAMRALASGEATLRNLDRCGLLARLLPELTRCRTLMPVDATHRYTVFEHTLRAVRALDELAPGSRLGEMKHSVPDLEPLYLSLLLHDTGKAEPGLPHSEAGEILCKQVTTRWKLGSGISDLVAWLVREHLTMAKFTRMRDVQDPRTALELAGIVREGERLHLLALLTFADMRAVDDSAWTPAQESNLLELHARTLDVLESSQPREPDPALFRRRLLRDLRNAEIPDDEVQEFLHSMPAHYVIATAAELVKLHLVFARKARSGEPSIELAHSAELRSTDVTICCVDSAGLLSRLLAAFYAWDLQVHGIRASTTSSEPRVAIDTFTVSFGDQPLPPSTCMHVTSDLNKVILGQEDPADLLRRKGKDPDRKQEHFQHVFLPGDPGILEVQAPRGRGMAYRISKVIAEQGWNIVSARIGQWAGRGAAAFYITSSDGGVLSASRVQEALASKV